MKNKDKKIVKEEEKKDKCTCENCNCNPCECDECNCEECNCENCECDVNEQFKELTDKLVRTQAEMINFKKRKEEETSNMLKYCNKDILLKIVSVIDNFERAFKMDDDNLTDEVSKFLDGFKMIYANLLEILKENEVVEIAVLGKTFDPNVMEAMLVEHFDGKEKNEVIDVLQKGYMYKDIVLRPAMVKIND